jgi:two-component system chemotaxis response regulator CheY
VGPPGLRGYGIRPGIAEEVSVMSRKVLVVDDSASVRQQVRLALDEAGFETVDAIDGVDGLNKLAEHPDLSLVICDVNMPNMDGLEMLEQALAQPSTRDIPIVMLTTEGQPGMIERAKQAGAKGWIVKPFKPHLLVATAEKLAAQP